MLDQTSPRGSSYEDNENAFGCCCVLYPWFFITFCLFFKIYFALSLYDTVPQFNFAIGRFSVGCLFGLFTVDPHKQFMPRASQVLDQFSKTCSMVSISCPDTNSLLLFSHFPSFFFVQQTHALLKKFLLTLIDNC